MKHLYIAQIAAQTGLTPHTLRYYEKEALIINVPRDNGGRRRYTENHLKGIKFINALRATGMPIRTIKSYLDLYQQGKHTHPARLDLLIKHKAKVEEELKQMKKNLKIVDSKILAY